MLALQPQLIEVVTWNGMLLFTTTTHFTFGLTFSQIMGSLTTSAPGNPTIPTMALRNGLTAFPTTAGA